MVWCEPYDQDGVSKIDMASSIGPAVNLLRKLSKCYGDEPDLWLIWKSDTC